MLEDRDYMRRPEFRSGWGYSSGRRWSWTVILLAFYALVFVAELLAQKFFPGNRWFQGHPVLTDEGVQMIPGYLPLSLDGIERGYLWQLIAYQFMHAGWLHLFLNGWAIYTFGHELENLLGGRKYLALMLSSGAVGGVLQMLVALLWPEYFGGSVVGASACAFGLVAAYAVLFPERELTMLIFFVFPIHIQAQTLLVFSAVLAVAGIVFPIDNVANAAHLGGMAMGWFLVRVIMQGHWPKFTGSLRLPGKMKQLRPAPEPAADEGTADFVASEVDLILDKISAQGIQSLTAREREILEKARAKMQQR